jgi:3-dehydroquinate synthase
VGINLPVAKNLVGAFHHPLAVYNDPMLLRTLPLHEVRQGLAEAIKLAVIASQDLFSFLETRRAAILSKDLDTISELDARAVKIKCDLLATDL